MDLLDRLEALARMWDDREGATNRGLKSGHAYELRVCLADERKRRATPIVDRSSEISWKDDDDDPDSRIVHGEPVESEAERVIARHNAKMAKVPSLNQRPKSVGEGLRFLAQWFDAMYPDDQEHAVQDDLRRWAADADADPRDALLSQAREVLGTMLTNVPWYHRGPVELAIAAIDDWKERA